MNKMTFVNQVKHLNLGCIFARLVFYKPRCLGLISRRYFNNVGNQMQEIFHLLIPSLINEHPAISYAIKCNILENLSEPITKSCVSTYVNFEFILIRAIRIIQSQNVTVMTSSSNTISIND
ncbi:hypothetical protein EGR_03607 [Echinococcus granulosus]|uniref:Uncharacterized protein n=1 Tax=Echinococcus granulosus TaxID=6210 RepID=W6UKE5_ECHGR|nr:hypothetical protein EGR_03607 [Echinococcus granulosus]EUB61543.1 hypothetical protein EGR_03607 [Echinococcus granulosus]